MALHDTYVAALRHDLVDLPEGTRLVGVVRRQTRWFAGAVDENRPELGPPEGLLDDVKRAEEDLKIAGFCEEEAHNAAWDRADFADRYRDHLADSAEATAAVDGLRNALEDGEDVALVCYENTGKKRCHRTLLREELERSDRP
ncbi:DUF488 family protein, N3 subclade [Halorarum salinum]|uniref:DUF488 family protein, N3 subclade n=1 Tax=Halorarum salinum TaxID=2743089 RepID=UPI001FECAB2A|nr:DUF488 family protein [Halobaculum salinum]